MSTEDNTSDPIAQRPDDGGPAFPRPGAFNGRAGLSLRDYFAAKAMASLLNVTWLSILDDMEKEEDLSAPDSLAICAYGLADSMLRARMINTRKVEGAQS